MLAMLGFVSMAIISDDNFTTGFQSPVDNENHISGHILFGPSMKYEPWTMNHFKIERSIFPNLVLKTRLGLINYQF